MEEKDNDIVPIQIKLKRIVRQRFKDKCKENDIHYGQWIRKQIENFIREEK